MDANSESFILCIACCMDGAPPGRMGPPIAPDDPYASGKDYDVISDESKALA